MPSLIDLILEGRRLERHQPWPRAIVDPAVWSFAAGQLAEGHWTLLGLWGEPETAHMALLDEPASRIAVIRLESMGGRSPSVAHSHPPAMLLERAARDLFGIAPTGLPDRRPWLDHNHWRVCHPL